MNKKDIKQKRKLAIKEFKKRRELRFRNKNEIEEIKAIPEISVDYVPSLYPPFENDLINHVYPESSKIHLTYAQVSSSVDSNAKFHTMHQYSYRPGYWVKLSDAEKLDSNE